MDIEQLQSLIKNGESHTIEFKKSTAQLRPAFETICAFLNVDGGFVMLGVNDKGQMIGQDVTDNTRQEIAREISKIEPPTEIKIDYVPIENNRTIIVIHVEKGMHAPYTYDGRPFQRDQSVTTRMLQQRYDQLVSRRTQLNHSWESFLSENNIDSISEESVFNFVKTAVDAKRLPTSALKDSMVDTLKKLKLLINDRILNAAIVLFGKEFFPDFPQCQLKLARFKGTTRSEFIDSEMFYGNAFDLVEKGMFFVTKHLPVAAKIVAGQQQRVETPLIPYTAIREALHNAICHRDYSRRGGSVGLAIYDDHMEIFNSGGLQPGLSLDIIKKGHSELRNPIIAEIFYMAGYIETWGRGIPEIIDSCKQSGDPEPEFIIHDDVSFSVQLKFPTHLRDVILSDFSEEELAAAMNIDINLARRLTNRQREILVILASAKELTVKQLFEKLLNPPSERMIRNELNQLKELDLIDSQGKARNTVWGLKKN